MRKRTTRILVAIMLALALLLPLVSGAEGAAPEFTDVRGHWAEYNIKNWLRMGLAGGYPDDTFRPNQTVNKAEFISFLNRAFGYTAKTDITFSDVSQQDWFYGDVSRAIKAGYVSGFADGTFRPREPISRIDAAELLYTAIKLDLKEFPDVVGHYSDISLLSEEQKAAANALVSTNLMVGSQNMFYPHRTITRAEAIAILDRAAGEIYKVAGTYGPEEGQQVIGRNVTVSVTGVTLRNMLVKGNLYLTEGIGDGEVTLHNVLVEGDTIIAGGGADCIYPTGTTTLPHVIITDPNGVVSIVYLDDSSSESVVWHSGGSYQGQAATSMTLSDNIPAGSHVQLVGNFTDITIDAPNITVEMGEGSTANSVTLSSSSQNSSLSMQGSTVGTVTLDTIAGLHMDNASHIDVLNTSVNSTGTEITVIGGSSIGTMNNEATINAHLDDTSHVDTLNDSSTDSEYTVIGGSWIGDKPEEPPTPPTGGDNPPPTIRVSGVSVDKTSMTLTVGGATGTITATVTPANAANKSVTWSSNDETIATVVDGVVTPVAPGTATITVTTVDKGYTATTAVTVTPAVIERADGDVTQDGGYTGGTLEYTFVAANKTLTIDADGAILPYYVVSGSTPPRGANWVGVAIPVPAGVDNSKVTATINNAPCINLYFADGKYMEYIDVKAADLTAGAASYQWKIHWGADYADETITINLVNVEALQSPVVRNANSVTQDPGSTGGSEIDYAFDPETKTLTISNGQVPYVDADGDFPPSNGNWVGVAIKAPAGFSGDIKSLTIDDKAYTGTILSDDEQTRGELWYYFKATTAADTHTLVIDWSEAYVEEIITVQTSNLTLGARSLVRADGDVTQDGGYTGGSLDYNFVAADKTLTIDADGAILPYYAVSGSTPPRGANWVGVAIPMPAGVDTSKVTATINGNNCTDLYFADGKHMAYIDVKAADLTAGAASYQWKIHWGADYADETISINLVNVEALQSPVVRNAGSVTQDPGSTGGSAIEYAFDPATNTLTISGGQVPYVEAAGDFPPSNGNWVGVAIKAPAGFSGDIKSLKIDNTEYNQPILSDDEQARGELWYYFKATTAADTHTLVIDWSDAYVEEIITIKTSGLSLGARSLVRADGDVTQDGGYTGGTLEYTFVAANNTLTIDANGAILPYYAVSGSTPPRGANWVGVAIPVPAGVDTSRVTATINGNDCTDLYFAYGKYMEYIDVKAADLTAGAVSYQWKIHWGADYADETITINVRNVAALQTPVLRNAGSVTQDPGSTGGSEIEYTFNPETKTLTISNGQVPYVEAAGGFPPSNGNWVGVAIKAPAGFSGDIKSLKIDDKAYTGDILSAEEETRGELWYYFDAAKGTEHTLVIDWSGAFVPETITVKTSGLSLGARSLVRADGDVTQDGGYTGGSLDYNFLAANKTLTIDANGAILPYYAVSGGTPPRGANWVGVAIKVPAGVDTSKVTATINGNDCTDLYFADGKYMEYIDVKAADLTAGAASYQWKIHWGADYADETITINLEDVGALQAPALRNAGSVTQDPGSTGGSEIGYTFNPETKTLTISNGQVPYVEAAGDFPPSNGNWVGVAIKAPAGFSEDIAGLTIDDQVYSGPFLSADEKTRGELWYYFKATTAADTHTLVIDWSGAFVPETITVKTSGLSLGARSLVRADGDVTQDGGYTGGTLEYTFVAANNTLTIDANGAILPYYAVSGSTPPRGANWVGVAIPVPAGVDTSKVTATINGNNCTDLYFADGKYMEYVDVKAADLTAGAASYQWKIHWGADYADETITINLVNVEALQSPVVRNANSVTQDPGFTGGSEIDYAFDPATNTLTISNGEVPYVEAAGDLPPSNGNWVGVAIKAPAGFSGDIKSLKIDGKAYTGDILSAEEETRGELWYYFLATTAADTHTLVIDWSDAYVEEIIIVKTSGLSLGARGLVRADGDVTQDGGYTGGTLEYTFVAANNTLTIDADGAILPYYAVSGSTPPRGANWVGVAIPIPAGVDTSKVTATINGNNCTDLYFADGKYMEYIDVKAADLTAGAASYQWKIHWGADYADETITINLEDVGGLQSLVLRNASSVTQDPGFTGGSEIDYTFDPETKTLTISNGQVPYVEAAGDFPPSNGNWVGVAIKAPAGFSGDIKSLTIDDKAYTGTILSDDEQARGELWYYFKATTAADTHTLVIDWSDAYVEEIITVQTSNLTLGARSLVRADGDVTQDGGYTGGTLEYSFAGASKTLTIDADGAILPYYAVSGSTPPPGANWVGVAIKVPAGVDTSKVTATINNVACSDLYFADGKYMEYIDVKAAGDTAYAWVIHWGADYADETITINLVNVATLQAPVLRNANSVTQDPGFTGGDEIDYAFNPETNTLAISNGEVPYVEAVGDFPPSNGNWVGVAIKAPAGFSGDIKSLTIDDKAYTGTILSQQEQDRGELWYYFKATTAADTHTLVIDWSGAFVPETITVKTSGLSLGARSLVRADGDVTQDGGYTGGTLEYSFAGASKTLTIDADGAILPYYAVSGSTPPRGANWVGVAIPIPAGVDTSKVTATINGNNCTDLYFADGKYMEYIDVKAADLTAGAASYQWKIHWGADYADETITINLANVEALQSPVVRNANSVTQDPGFTGGSEIEYTFNPETKTLTISNGQVPYVEAAGDFPPSNGNWVGVAIKAPAGFSGDIAGLTIDDQVYSGPFLSADEKTRGELWYYFKATTTDDTHTLVIDWSSAFVPETITVKTQGLTLETYSNYALGSTAPATAYAGQANEFTVSAAGDGTGNTSYTAIYRYEITGGAYKLEYKDGDIWRELTGGYFGPSTGFELTPNWNATTNVRFTALEEATYQINLTLETMDGKVLATESHQIAVATANGTIAWDPGFTGGSDLDVDVDASSNTITFNGEIDWYLADEALGRAAGNRVGVEIIPPAGFDASEAEVTIGENKYTIGTERFFWYPLVTAAGQEFTATVKWNSICTQVLTVKISGTATLEEKHVAGTIAWDPGFTGGSDLDVAVDVNNNTITFDGEIDWYPADETLGRAAGNRVGVEIIAPVDFNASLAKVTIGGTDYTFGTDRFFWYPLVTAAGQEFTATVKWNSASTQAFTVKLAGTATLQVVHTVTFEDHDGTVLKTETVVHGQGATAPADPSRTGYTFDDWDVAFGNVTGDLTVTATYDINQYTITFASAGGTDVAAIKQDYGTEVTAPADPTKTGYTFDGWDPAVPATMPANNLTLTAQWTINSYAVQITVQPSEGGVVTGASTYNYGTPVTVTATANVGYDFVNWTEGGVSVSTDTSYTFAAVANRSLIANFRLKTYSTYTVTIDGPAYISVGAAAAYEVTATGDNTGNSGHTAIYDYAVTGGEGTLEYNDNGTWRALPLSGQFGPAGGFALTPDYTATTELRFTPAEQTTYSISIDLKNMSGQEIASAEAQAVSMGAATANITASVSEFSESGVKAFEVTVNGVNLSRAASWTLGDLNETKKPIGAMNTVSTSGDSVWLYVFDQSGVLIGQYNVAARSYLSENVALQTAVPPVANVSVTTSEYSESGIKAFDVVVHGTNLTEAASWTLRDLSMGRAAFGERLTVSTTGDRMLMYVFDSAGLLIGQYDIADRVYLQEVVPLEEADTPMANISATVSEYAGTGIRAFEVEVHGTNLATGHSWTLGDLGQGKRSFGESLTVSTTGQSMLMFVFDQAGLLIGQYSIGYRKYEQEVVRLEQASTAMANVTVTVSEYAGTGIKAFDVMVRGTNLADADTWTLGDLNAARKNIGERIVASTSDSELPLYVFDDGGEVIGEYIVQYRDCQNEVVKLRTVLEIGHAVTFTVKDVLGLPVQNAEVTVNSSSRLVDSEGQAVFTLADGQYVYTVSCPGYKDASSTVTVGGAAQSVIVTLAEETYSVAFTVTNLAGSPIAGAIVTIGAEAKATDANGTAAFSLPSGSYNYSISQTNYVASTGSLVVGTTNKALTVAMTHVDEVSHQVVFVVRHDGIPVAGATVSILASSITTGSDGTAIISLTNGSYGYAVTALGFNPASGTVIVDNGADEVSVSLAPASYAVVFTVTDGSANPVEDAVVTITGRPSVSTGLQGTASIELTNGSYSYTVSKDGFLPVTRPFTVANGGQSIGVILLDPEAVEYAVTFRVTADGTLPIVGAEVNILGETVSTDATGEALFHLVIGSYPYTVNAEQHLSASGDITVAGDDVELAVTLAQLHEVTFAVTATGGVSPVAGATVTIGSTTLATDADGVARFALPDGNYGYEISKLGYDTKTGLFSVAGAAIPVSVELDETRYSVTFTIKEGDQPIAGASVTIGAATIATDSDGVAVFQLVSDAYSYIVEASGFLSATGGVNVPYGDASETVVLKRPTTNITATKSFFMGTYSWSVVVDSTDLPGADKFALDPYWDVEPDPGQWKRLGNQIIGHSQGETITLYVLDAWNNLIATTELQYRDYNDEDVVLTMIPH